MTIMRRAVIATVLASLGACTAVERFTNRSEYFRVGLPYRAFLDTGETRRDFTVTARAEGASLEEARESIRYPATRHCIEETGFSTVEWVLDPTTGDWAVTRAENGDLIASGVCLGR